MILPKPGELNRRCSVYSAKLLPNGKAEHSTERIPLWECWCKVEVIGGSVYWDNVQTEETVTHRIFVRSVKGKTRPQDLPRLIEVECDGLWYRAKRVTDCNSAGRFTLLECEVLNAALKN
jgi:hypothetical protein